MSRKNSSEIMPEQGPSTSIPTPNFGSSASTITLRRELIRMDKGGRCKTCGKAGYTYCSRCEPSQSYCTVDFDGHHCIY
jgi:hypothetical protein